jgi:hypothetical protein
MTSISLFSVPSGISYRVLAVDDAPPQALTDFAGEVTFTLDTGAGVYQVTGTGAAVDGAVRFFEKTPTGKDLRVWSIRQVEDGFEAVHAAVF